MSFTINYNTQLIPTATDPNTNRTPKFDRFIKYIGNKIAFPDFGDDQESRQIRRENLITELGAKKIENLELSDSGIKIDGLCFPTKSSEKTGGAVLFVLTKSYQRFHPRQFQHLLDDGADVIVFNPTQLDVKIFSSDLKKVILAVKKNYASIALSGKCLGGYIAAHVATEFSLKTDFHMPVIADRSYVDICKLAKKIFPIISKLNRVQRVVSDTYCISHDTEADSLKQLKAPILFLSPHNGLDQLTQGSYNGDLTQEMFKAHSNPSDTWFNMDGDHFTPLPVEAHNAMKHFLKKQGIIRKGYRTLSVDDFGGKTNYKSQMEISYFRRKILPKLM